jgi:5S rRNA maturation endonuclease (ribonuclease M5)
MDTLIEIIGQINEIVDIVIVEGSRDIIALKRLGYEGNLVSCQHVGVNNYEFITRIANENNSILILTDFDKEGLFLNSLFSRLLEQKNVKIEYGLRRAIGRLTASLGVYSIEDLDNAMDNLYREVN